jgi:hypothetical protein
MDRAEVGPRPPGDGGILALGVDHQRAAPGGEQVGDDGGDALAGAGRAMVIRCAGPA